MNFPRSRSCTMVEFVLFTIGLFQGLGLLGWRQKQQQGQRLKCGVPAAQAREPLLSTARVLSLHCAKVIRAYVFLGLGLSGNLLGVSIGN